MPENPSERRKERKTIWYIEERDIEPRSVTDMQQQLNKKLRMMTNQESII